MSCGCIDRHDDDAIRLQVDVGWWLSRYLFTITEVDPGLVCMSRDIRETLAATNQSELLFYILPSLRSCDLLNLTYL